MELQNGAEALVAYYFKITGHPFLDEIDFKILLKMAKLCEITIDFPLDNNSISILFQQILKKLQDLDKGFYTHGRILKYHPFNFEEKDAREISKLILLRLYGKENGTYCLYDRHVKSFDILIGNDMDILKSKMPNPDLFRDYMTAKKIILCKLPNIYSGERDWLPLINSDTAFRFFDDWAI